MSTRIGRAMRRRPQLLPQPACIYGAGKYPIHVRISFADGRTKVYDERTTQPGPAFFSDADIRRMSHQDGSYKYTQRRLSVWERLLKRITKSLYPTLRK